MNTGGNLPNCIHPGGEWTTDQFWMSEGARGVPPLHLGQPWPLFAVAKHTPGVPDCTLAPVYPEASLVIAAVESGSSVAFESQLVVRRSGELSEFGFRMEFQDIEKSRSS